jgi:hypothetical protein
MVVTVFYVLLIEFCCMKPLRAALRDNVFLSHTYNDDQLRSRNQSSCRCWNDALVIHTREIGKYTVERDESVHVLRMVPVSLTRPTNEAFKYVVP